MYDTILEQLKTKFSGVSEDILGRVAKKLAGTAKTEDEVKTAVDGVTFQQLLESYGDSRAIDATKTAVMNYEKKHGLKDGKVVTPQPPLEPTPQTDDTPAWAQALVASVKSLSSEVATMKGEKVAASRRQKLEEALKPLPETLRRAYERTPYTDLKDDEFDTLLGDITAEVGEIAKAEKSKGLVFGTPTVPTAGSRVTNAPTASDKEVTAVVDKLLPNV